MKKEINGKTKIIGIIGKNIENSLSPLIHNQIILKHSLNFCYLPFQVAETNLDKAIQGIKALNIRGVNITFPYKEKVIKFLDEVEESARRIIWLWISGERLFSIFLPIIPIILAFPLISFFIYISTLIYYRDYLTPLAMTMG